jgi:putative ABC transport system substrate-binding protein
MRRRDFIKSIGGAALTWPLAARAQQVAMPVIGLLNGQQSAISTHLLAAFRAGLTDIGFGEGRNLAIVYRSAESEVGRLPALAEELVRLKVAVIAAVGGDMCSPGSSTTCIRHTARAASDSLSPPRQPRRDRIVSLLRLSS